MYYCKAGEAFRHSVDFVNNLGQLVVPDASSVTLELEDNDGDLISPYNPQAITTTGSQTSLDITIQSSANAKTRSYEFRTISVRYTVSGKTFVISVPYRIVSRTRFPIAPSEIRSLLGLEENELADAEIDLVSAYLSVQADVGSSVDLETLLTTGDAKAEAIVKAIGLKAAINLAYSLPLRAIQKEQADNVVSTRFAKIDWDSIMAQLRADYTVNLGIINTARTYEPYIGFTKVVGTDPITGV